MKILLDEDVPKQALPVLERVLRGHQVDHVHGIRWSGKPDDKLYPDAAARGYEALVTNDAAQMEDPDECRAIKKSGMHRISYKHRHPGLRGLAVAVASLIAAMPDVVNELDNAGGQRLVAIEGINPSRKRYKITDPGGSRRPTGRGDHGRHAGGRLRRHTDGPLPGINYLVLGAIPVT